MPRQQDDIPSFPTSRPPPDAAPRRYRHAPTTVSKWGYVFEWCPTHPKSLFGTIQQHRLIMECHLGRFLKPGEVVHHRSTDRTDNHLENLRLFASNEEHMREHHQERRRDPALVLRVAAAAADRSISFASLGMSPTTVAKICRENGITWLRRGRGALAFELTEQTVREAL